MLTPARAAISLTRAPASPFAANSTRAASSSAWRVRSGSRGGPLRGRLSLIGREAYRAGTGFSSVWLTFSSKWMTLRSHARPDDGPQLAQLPGRAGARMPGRDARRRRRPVDRRADGRAVPRARRAAGRTRRGPAVGRRPPARAAADADPVRARRDTRAAAGGPRRAVDRAARPQRDRDDAERRRPRRLQADRAGRAAARRRLPARRRRHRRRDEKRPARPRAVDHRLAGPLAADAGGGGRAGDPSARVGRDQRRLLAARLAPR